MQEIAAECGGWYNGEWYGIARGYVMSESEENAGPTGSESVESEHIGSEP